jgi:hypothetical protein
MVVRNTTEKERKDLAEKTRTRETSQPYASESEDRAEEHARKKHSAKHEGPGEGDGDHDTSERAAP